MSALPYEAKLLAETIDTEQRPRLIDLDLLRDAQFKQVELKDSVDRPGYKFAEDLPISQFTWVEALGDDNPYPMGTFFDAVTDPALVDEYYDRLEREQQESAAQEKSYKPIELFLLPRMTLELIDGNHRKAAKLHFQESTIPALIKPAGYWEAQNEFAKHNLHARVKTARIMARMVWHYKIDPPPQPEAALRKKDELPTIADILELSGNSSGSHLFTDPEVAAANKRWGTLEMYIWTSILQFKPTTIINYARIAPNIAPDVLEEYGLFQPTEGTNPFTITFYNLLNENAPGEANFGLHREISDKLKRGEVVDVKAYCEGISRRSQLVTRPSIIDPVTPHASGSGRSSGVGRGAPGGRRPKPNAPEPPVVAAQTAALQLDRKLDTALNAAKSANPDDVVNLRDAMGRMVFKIVGAHMKLSEVIGDGAELDLSALGLHTDSDRTAETDEDYFGADPEDFEEFNENNEDGDGTDRLSDDAWIEEQTSRASTGKTTVFDQRTSGVIRRRRARRELDEILNDDLDDL